MKRSRPGIEHWPRRVTGSKSGGHKKLKRLPIDSKAVLLRLEIARFALLVRFGLNLTVPSARSTASFRGSLISQSEIRATVASGDTRATGHKMMKRFLLLPAAVMLAVTSAATVPVQAGGGDVAAGLIGGLAAGTIIGAAVTAPRYYGPPPPVYVGPAPYCYWTQGQPVWDPYRGAWMYPAVRVCE
jgi:hypothetical protein